MQTEQNLSTVEKEAPTKSFDAIAAELLKDESLKSLEGVQRGQVIIDRFIGSLVRHGDVVGSNETVTPAIILGDIDRMGKGNNPEEVLKGITNTNKLRRAVLDLSLDPDVGPLVGKFSERLKTEDNDKYTLTSPAQIEGYLLAAGSKNSVQDPRGGIEMHGDTWIPVILEQTKRMAADSHITWMTSSQQRGLIDSGLPLLRNAGNDWRMATTSAEKVGVDLDLIRRSAEKVQQRVKDNHELGHTGLFLATDGKIEGYKQDLSRRSVR